MGLPLATRLYSNFSHTHKASFQRLPNRTYVEMIATHRYSSPKTGGSYHALVLTSEYAITLQTSTSYIYAIMFSAGLNAFQVDQITVGKIVFRFGESFEAIAHQS